MNCKSDYTARYYVSSYEYTGHCVMDERNDFPLAVCHVNMDSDATEEQDAADARLRAQKIATALNESAFDWQPPG
jgi:hypothetical protein